MSDDRAVSTRTARVARTCDHCGRPIHPGTVYTRIVQFPTVYRRPQPDGYDDPFDVPFGVQHVHDLDGYCIMG